MKQAIENENANAVATEIGSRLRAFNENHAGPLNHQRLVLSIRDDHGALVAGLTADFHWQCITLTFSGWNPNIARKDTERHCCSKRNELLKNDRVTSFTSARFNFKRPSSTQSMAILWSASCKGSRAIPRANGFPRSCTSAV